MEGGPGKGQGQEEFGYLEKTDADGNVVRQKVEKALLDLTVCPRAL